MQDTVVQTIIVMKETTITVMSTTLKVVESVFLKNSM